MELLYFNFVCGLALDAFSVGYLDKYVMCVQYENFYSLLTTETI